MSYEHGKAPADAPVTWRDRPYHRHVLLLLNGSAKKRRIYVRSRVAANTICRAFHLAKLAEEARAKLDLQTGEQSICALNEWTRDWLDRFDAATGKREQGAGPV